MWLLDHFRKQKSPTLTSWSVVGLGALVALLGYTLSDYDKKLGAGVTGFGLAHILLGALDMLRPAVKGR
ncbi:MAG: hypothetical protein GX996_04025 [Firmicutes bacterium]|nr:hypothetical protein [Bacillota bacterium]